MARGENHGEPAAGAPDIADGVVLREVKLLGQRLEVSELQALHRCHELLEPRRVAVELLEYRLTGVLDLVLGLAGVCSASVRSPQNRYNRALAISKIPPM